jgi:hypothetical protein
LYYTNFSAGLNTKSSLYLLDEGLGPLPSRDLSNVQGTTAGAIVKRNGLLTLASPPAAAVSLYAFEVPSPMRLVLVAGGQMYSCDANGNLVSLKSGLSTTVRWEFASALPVGAQGPLYGLNGTDAPQAWDGVAGATSNWTATTGSVPNGKFCLWANQQMFVAGDPAFPSRVYWSAILDPTSWDQAALTGAGFTDFDPRDGQRITALGRVGPYVLVAKPRKLWVLVDTGVYPALPTIRQLSDSIGCVAHRSLAQGSQGTFLLSEDRGVYVTNGSSLTPVSDSIQPTIDIAQGLLSLASGVYYSGHYYLSLAIGGAAVNDTVLDYDTTLQSWWKHSFGSNQFAVWHVNNVAKLFSAKATSGIIDQCFAPDVVTDNGAPFQWIWRGPWQSPSFYRRRLFPTPYYRKRLRQVRLDGRGTVDFSLAKDFAATESLIRANILGTPVVTDTWAGSTNWSGDGLWAGGPGVHKGRAYTLGVADAFSVVFSATSNTQDVVTSYALMMQDRKDGVT